MPINTDTSYSRGGVAEINELSVSIDGFDPGKKENSDMHRRLFDSIQQRPDSLIFDAKYNSYKISVETKQAGEGFHLLKVNPVKYGGSQPKNIFEWYLALCVDGFGGEGKCFFSYVWEGMVINYSLGERFVSNWQSIVRAVNDRVEALACDQNSQNH